DVSEVAERLMARFWPGPLSLIFHASPVVPDRVRGAGDTVALRVPRDTLCERMLERIGGPVVSSSANLTGQPPAETAEEVARIFGNQLDLVVDGGPRSGHTPSTLVDVSGPKPRLLRRGALDVRGEMGDFVDETGHR
ncbi:MAG: L-threonylcarbamoyladenylate synthase, partial [Candidatus Eisenbacteria bacterium]